MKYILLIITSINLIFCHYLSAQNSLIAHWNFDETEFNKFVDSSNNGNDIIVNGPFDTYRIQSVKCVKGRALLFKDYPLYGTLKTNEQDLKGLTVEAWIHPLGFSSNSNVYRNIIGLKSEKNQELLVFCVRGNGMLFGRCCGIWGISSKGTLVADVWQHVAVTFKGNTISLYINGKLVKQRNYGKGFEKLPQNIPVQIGGGLRGFTRPRIPGTEVGIDNCKIYGRVLTQEEIASSFASGKDAYLVTTRPVQPKKSIKLTMVSYNVMQYAGFCLKGKNPPGVKRYWKGKKYQDKINYFTEALKSLEGDIYVLQEAAYPPINKAIAEKLKMNYRPFVFSPDEYNSGRNMSAGGILSRYPIKEFKGYPRFKFGNDSCRTRIFFRATITVPGFGDIMIYNLHLWPYGPDNGRIEQVNIYRLLREERRLGIPQFLIGDFNRRPDSFLVTNLGYRGWTNFVLIGKAEKPGSWNAEKQYINIDWIIARGVSDWKLTSCDVPRNNYTAATEGATFTVSDHLPVRAVFEIPLKENVKNETK